MKERGLSHIRETTRNSNKRGGLRTLTAGLVLAGSLHGASFAQNQVYNERPTISASAAVGAKSNEINASIPQHGIIINFGEAKRKEKEYILSKEWLQEEVARERGKTILPGETPWYHLAGTGFWVKEQVSQLLRNVSRVGREAFSDVLEKELSKVKVDMEAFEDEYLKQMVNLRWKLALETRDGKQRLVCPDYNNVTLESATSKDERDGVVYEALFGEEGLEKKIATAPVNSFGIVVSNEGWSGLKTADNKNITYPESQIYVLKKLEDGGIQAYTFRYKANILQNEALQQSLGLTIADAKDQKERIKNALLNVAFITPEEANQAEREGRRPIRDFNDVIDLMQKAVGGKEEAYDGKTFDDMRAFLAHPERFTQRHPLTEKLITRFQNYARWRLLQGGTLKNIETDLQIALAMTPLHLNKLYREETEEKQVQKGVSEAVSTIRLVASIQIPGGMNYQKEHALLKELPGCAGGSTQVTSMGSSRRGEIGNSSENYNFDHEGTCVVCNSGPTKVGPCNICIPCDAKMGGKGAELVAA